MKDIFSRRLVACCQFAVTQRQVAKMPNPTDVILAWVPCWDCGGRGHTLIIFNRGPGDPPGNRQEACEPCHGSGQRPLYEQLWETCKGSFEHGPVRLHGVKNGQAVCNCGGKGLVPNVTLEGVLEVLLGRGVVTFVKDHDRDTVTYGVDVGDAEEFVYADTLLEAASAALAAVTPLPATAAEPPGAP